jgi:hypothetical protein
MARPIPDAPPVMTAVFDWVADFGSMNNISVDLSFSPGDISTTHGGLTDDQ